MDTNSPDGGQPAAPAAPAGYYPDPDGSGTDRYWDGSAWETKPELASAPAAPDGRKKPRRWTDKQLLITVGAIFGGIVLIAVAFNVSNTQTDAAPASSLDTSAAVADASPTIPAGYRDFGDTGVAFKFNHDDPACQISTLNCSKVNLFSEYGCPNGVYIEANTLDDAGTVDGYTNGTLSSLAQGQTGLVEMDITVAAATSVQITKIDCN